MSGNPSGELSPQEKRALLEKLLKEKAAQTQSAQNNTESAEGFTRPEQNLIPLLDRSQRYFPLSSAQQRLWLLDQLDPGNPVYNISIIVRLRGNLNVRALQESLTRIMERHEILRVNFSQIEGEPVQFVVAERNLSLSIIDLHDQPLPSRLDKAEQLAEENAQHSFDLSRDVLARANLFHLAEEDYLFQFVVHHIVFDGWSLNIFLQELTSFYTALSRNEESSLPALPVQYIDFASWQVTQLEEGVSQGHLDYWKQQLGTDLPILEMPLDKPRPELQTYRAAKELLEVPAPLTEGLNRLSRQEGVTLFVTLLSVYYILLARYTAHEDIIVGTPVARRSRAEAEKLIGVFINNLALRVRLSGHLSFRQLLQQVRRTVLDALAHQDIPFERLLKELRIERDSSHSPVFQVFFNLLDIRKGVNLELPNVQVETPSLPETGSSFDITLYAQNWGDTLKLKLVYNSDLFESETMAEFIHRYHSLLEQVVQNPDQQIFTLPLPDHTKQKQQAILKSLRRLPNDFCSFSAQDENQSVADTFEQQVAKFPNHVAVKTDAHEWTYEQLSQIANRAAHRILGCCQHADDRVALLFEHGAPMIAGMLAALKAGKTYIPLDPHYPPERLEYMLSDSRVRMILTDDSQAALAEKFGCHDIPIVNIDQLESLPHHNPSTQAQPDAIAYILYTSGSTGQPKGVMQNHRNILHFIKAYTNNLSIGSLDRLTLLSSYSFDAAVMDIFGALLNGATIYPIDIRRQGMANLAQYLNESRITIYHSTPTVYRYFLNSVEAATEFPFIRLVVLGGEAVVKHDVDLYKKHFNDTCVFINGLGPTESTVSLQYFVDKQTRITQNAVPVGYPVEETEIVLLDEQGAETPLLGEIGIRSPYVALGYWQKDEITRAAFSTGPGEKRTYRTGDLGFRLPDGSLEFRGRRDFQVKIRGHRVEVGEVETRLAEHNLVQECVVTAREDGTGEKRLVAYFVHNGSQPSGGELRQFLQNKLPDYMIPAVFVPMKSLPLTPTGKIDRRALPEPDVETVLPGNAQVPARNETEQELVKIWQDLLKVQPIGVRDNFFELGGHSLLAVHMFARIHQEFGVNLPLATLFREATIEYLADTIVHSQSQPDVWSSLIPIETQGSHAPFFCVHGLTGDILWFRDLAQCLAPSYPFFGLQSRGLDGVQNPLTRIEEMAAHYIEEIRRLQPNGPYYLGGASFGGTIALEMAQQLQAQGEEISMLAIFDHSPPNIDLDDHSSKLKRRLIIVHRIVKNFPYWLKEFMQMGPSRMMNRIRRKLRLIQKMNDGIHADPNRQFDAEDLIDFASELSAHRQKLITSNYQAMKEYVPRPYAGTVTLFRALNRPLLNIYDPETGWQKLAPGRVTVYDVPSSHEGMFKKPHVRDLAEKLRTCLGELVP